MSDQVIVETSLGAFTLSLDSERAPGTVANFLRYVDAGHYRDTIFHRVIPGFMAQGGGYDTSYQRKPTQPPVQSEADNGLKNLRGTVAMARTSDPHSATAQFFVNLVDNAFLDHQAKSGSGWGYTVFGQVSAGMEVVDTISAQPTGAVAEFSKDAPKTQIVIHAIRRA
ncbi:MAG: peptidylprolyl isomerase [Haliangiales bacterium]